MAILWRRLTSSATVHLVNSLRVCKCRIRLEHVNLTALIRVDGHQRAVRVLIVTLLISSYSGRCSAQEALEEQFQTRVTTIVQIWLRIDCIIVAIFLNVFLQLIR